MEVTETCRKQRKRRVTFAIAPRLRPARARLPRLQRPARRRRLAHRLPRTGRPRAGPGHHARSRRPGLLRARRELARLVWRAHLDRREAGQRQRIHRARGRRLAPQAHRHGAGRAASAPPTAAGTAHKPELLGDIRGPGVDAIIERIEGRDRRISLSRSLPRLAGSELQHVHRVRAAQGAGAARRPAAHGHRQGLPGLALGEPHARAARAARPVCSEWSASPPGSRKASRVNVLGLNFGVDPKSLSLKLPIVGRLGPARDNTPRLVDEILPVLRSSRRKATTSRICSSVSSSPHGGM